MVKTLDNAKPGDQVVISSINAPIHIRQRFMDMGLIKGTKINIQKYAPLGNPIQIEIKGYTLCLRKEDAKYIEII